MKTDVVIVGGGPGGTTAAMYLAREGIQSIIVEQAEFPRYHIGESMTGEAGFIVRELGLTEEMEKHEFPVKKGTKVLGPTERSVWWIRVAGRNQDNELFNVDTWQVRRSDFDKIMLDAAVTRGIPLIVGKATRPLLNDDGSIRGVEVRLADRGTVEIEAEVVLDCSGQSTFLANAGVTGPKYLGNYDKQIAIFSQVKGAIRDNGGSRQNDKDNTLIFYKSKFHWSWFIPLNEEDVSVGVVIPSAYFVGKKESKRDFLVRELHELHPDLARRVPEINLVEDVRGIPNYSYQVRGFCGKGYICIGDAHRFIDPIFSFGLAVTMLEAKMAVPHVKAYLEGKNRDSANPFAAHQFACEHGADVLEDMIDLFWEQPLAFAFFVHARYIEDLTDAFAGRIHVNQPSRAIMAFRKMLKRERQYDDGDFYSVPIGSRYHPERAPLWQANASQVVGLDL